MSTWKTSGEQRDNEVERKGCWVQMVEESYERDLLSWAFFPAHLVSRVEYKMLPQAHVLYISSPAGGIILGGSRNFRRWA
jgi:hypothetical protein